MKVSEYYDIIDKEVGKYATRVSPAYESDDLNDMSFYILDDDGPVEVVVRRVGDEEEKIGDKNE